MMGFKRGTVCAALLLSSSFAANATTTTYAFSSVTGIQYGPGNISTSITGALAGAGAPATITFVARPDTNCAGFIMTMISNPGTYSLTIVTDEEAAPPPLGGTSTSITTCGLSRNP
jgi:hypothetical protein